MLSIHDAVLLNNMEKAKLSSAPKTNHLNIEAPTPTMGVSALARLNQML